MAFDLSIFRDEGLEESFLDWLTDDHSNDIVSNFNRLWEYYQNPIYELGIVSGIEGKLNEASRNYVQGQELGLPPRITGLVRAGHGTAINARAISDIQRKEVVIENDITWRISAMVDFLFGKGVSFTSKAPDSKKRAEIESILKALFTANGAIVFFQDMAVLGSVYGFVDCIIRPSESLLNRSQSRHSSIGTTPSASTPPSVSASFETALKLASTIGLDLIEAPRALPILDENDYRNIKYYVQHFRQQKNSVNANGSFLQRLFGHRRLAANQREVMTVTEILGPDAWQRYENKQLAAEGPNPFGVVPVVHIQNIAQPYYYEGISDVEPLIPLQDELNTRLSDRASRITFQSFKMYLAKGLEGFEDKPVSPGRMWCTDNPDASIEAFGGESATPSEDLHIMEIREAMDKTSGVPPVVAGVLKNKLGNLTSATAIKMTMMGMLAKTDRKKFTYGEGLRKICQSVLDILDKAGVYHTENNERELEIVFPSPLPENMTEKLNEAQIKMQLGISREQVLRELGYETTF